MTNQEKKIPNLITNPEYLERIFNERIKDINKKGEKVLQLRTYKVKDHLDDKFFHFVLQNNLTIKLNNGMRRRYKVFCVAFSAHKRKMMYEVLRLAHENGFDKGGAVVPRPLWYVDELMAVFYIGVPGQNFLEHIKNDNINLNLVRKIGSGLFKLHQIKIDKKIGLKKHSFSLDYLDPTGVVDREYNKKTELARGIKNEFKKLRAIHKNLVDDELVLSHGDFHPENVIVHEFRNNKVAIIDFSESCLAPAFYDIASFLQQFGFMTRSYLTEEQYLKIEKVFLESYWGEVEVTREMWNKINLYKAWTALKSAVYFMIFRDEVNLGFVRYLLKRAGDFSNKI